MELDTGASLSIISEKTYKSLWLHHQQPVSEGTNVGLHNYTKETIRVLGQIAVEVTFKEQVTMLPWLVVARKGPSLLGRDWLAELQLDWCELNAVYPCVSLQKILKNHSSIFKEELGEAVGMTAKLYVCDNAKPSFYRARTVPQALRTKLEQKLDCLERQKVIESVQMSEWAAPIVRGTPILSAKKMEK